MDDLDITQIIVAAIGAAAKIIAAVISRSNGSNGSPGRSRISRRKRGPKSK